GSKSGLLPESAGGVNTILNLFQREWISRSLRPRAQSDVKPFPRMFCISRAVAVEAAVSAADDLTCADDTCATGRTRRGEPPTTAREIHPQAENSRGSLASSRLNA